MAVTAAVVTVGTELQRSESAVAGATTQQVHRESRGDRFPKCEPPSPT